MTSLSMLRIAPLSCQERQEHKLGSPTRSNSNNRRQWRIKGVAVGAAASKT